MTNQSPITQDPPASSGKEASAQPGGAAAPSELPVIETSLQDDEIRERLAAACRRGKLPGYEGAPRQDGAVFTMTDFGFPFESRLIVRRAPGAPGAPARLLFETKLKPLIPGIFAAILILSVWPGVWFTESMLETYLPGTWITRYTWWWYLILTVPFLPWAMWAAVKKSRASGRAEAARLIARIDEELRGGSKAAGQQTGS